MASNTSMCGICSLRQITTTSDHWCPECEEAICEECKEHHKVLKATRNHKPIPISNYKSLPSFISDMQQACIYHNERYQLYCTEHNLPICIKCIKDHQKCTISPLDEVINNVKTSDQFQDLETRLEDLLQNFDKIKKDRKANVTKIEELKTQQVKKIKQIRVEINEHFDNLEKQIIRDFEKKESQCKETIQKVLSSVNEKEIIINQCQTNLQGIKQYATDLQTFLGMTKMEVNILENEQYLQSLLEKKSFEQLGLVFKVDKSVQSIFNTVKIFGLIEIKKYKSDIELTRAKDKQAQQQVVDARKTVDDVGFILQKKIKINGDIVRGCCMSEEGEFLFTDHVKNILNVIASDGALKYRMKLNPSYGFDITFVDETTVAITSGDAETTRGIDIINRKSRSKQKFISLPGRPYGITRDQDNLFVCVEGHGIFKMNIFDYTTSQVIFCYIQRYSYVSVSKGKIYYTDDKSLVCCDHNGSRVWDFKDDSVLICPTGITVDNDGHVFVVGQRSSNVIIISNDGKHHKIILTKEDGLCEPAAIFLDKQKRELLVTNLKHTAFLYNVT